jgi:putative acetyltransferase
LINIRSETNRDIDGIYHVNEQAFNRKTEADLVDNLRINKAITLSLIAEVEEKIIGHILFSPVIVQPDQSDYNSVTLAPLAVLPACQHKGIGSQLIRTGLKECRLLGHDFVFLVGHPEYYPRFGFIQAKSKGLKCEFEAPDEAWMLVQLDKKTSIQTGGTVYFRTEFRDAM